MNSLSKFWRTWGKVHSDIVWKFSKNRAWKFKKLSRRYAQKGYTGYAKHKGSFCPRDNGENQKNWLHRDFLYCDANHHVRKRLRVSVDEGLEWISELTIGTYDQHKRASIFIHGYASPSSLVAATSPIPISSIILVERHYQQQQPRKTTTTTTIPLSIIVHIHFIMMKDD